MSVSTMSNGTRRYRRSASSILSSDSDIRFTRRKLSSQFKCGCCILASFLLLLLAAAAAIYIGYTFFFTQPPDEQVFRATFKVIEGDTFTSDLTDSTKDQYLTKSRDYRERLNLLFRRSHVKNGFGGIEILALDGTEGTDLVVHFNIHIDPTYVSTSASDLHSLLISELSLTPRQSTYFHNLTIDTSTLEVIENYDILSHRSTLATNHVDSSSSEAAITSSPPPPRRCEALKLGWCSNVGYNVTSYPNVLGHRTLHEVQENVIAFRELVDGECYRLAYDFICRLLQPRCKRVYGGVEDELMLPCRSYCRDFMSGCNGRLNAKLKEFMDCTRFPEYEGDGSCTPKPDCVQEMQARALSPRICDGVIDCQDLSDERTCSYCSSDQIHCGIGRACIKNSKRCDGRKDCPDGSDERACLSIAPSVLNITKVRIVTPHLQRYHHEGFVVFNEKGEIGKLCTENLNESLPANQTTEILHTVASSLCKTLTYEKVLSVQVEKDFEENIPYVSMKDPLANEITFVRTPCRTKQVLKVGCADIECGLQQTHTAASRETLAKMATHGDWPWHVAMYKEDVHTCDGTLIAEDWVVTTTSCFQGQPKAEWIAKVGSVRLSSSTPWDQERRIVGMVKSPVEGSTIALVKLEERLHMNDFVRPACLPQKTTTLTESLYCNTLGWARNRDQLQRVQIKIIHMEKCENVSISTVNSLCTEASYPMDDCNEEEFAGSPMLCIDPNTNRWSLIGVTNWRIACSKSGVNRPRMYDKTTSNIDWILDTIKNSENVKK